MHDHAEAYAEARRPCAVEPVAPAGAISMDVGSDRNAARRRQQEFLEARRTEEESFQAKPHSPCQGVKRPLGHQELGPATQLPPEMAPRSPKELAVELIATSGVWRSKEQYLVTLFVLQPLQHLWEQALHNGYANELKMPGGLAKIAQGMQVRSVFLHGPGGSGKTYGMTEAVIKVAPLSWPSWCESDSCT